MSEADLFPNIDTSYWRTKDRDWMAQREADWPRIERMYEPRAHKSRKGLTAIKRYYLKGQLPNWDAMRDWQDARRHVDLFAFIWLHPSEDPAVLVPLRNAYVHSHVVTIEDVEIGIGGFLGAAIVGTVRKWAEFPERAACAGTYVVGRNEQLFDIMMGNPCEESIDMEVQWNRTERRKLVCRLPKGQLYYLNQIREWLSLKALHPVNEDFLLQYDRPLEWWYRGCVTYANEFDRWLDKKDQMVGLTYAALDRIHTFDTEAEGDTCRTRFVRKMRGMLDERDFFPAFKQAWLDVRDGRVRVGEVPRSGWVEVTRVEG